MIKKAVYYRLVIFYACLFSINALSTAIVASFMNTEWSELSPTSKFLLMVVVLQNWSGTILAFFNKTVSKIDDNKPIFELSDVTKQP